MEEPQPASLPRVDVETREARASHLDHQTRPTREDDARRAEFDADHLWADRTLGGLKAQDAIGDVGAAAVGPRLRERNDDIRAGRVGLDPEIGVDEAGDLERGRNRLALEDENVASGLDGGPVPGTGAERDASCPGRNVAPATVGTGFAGSWWTDDAGGSSKARQGRAGCQSPSTMSGASRAARAIRPRLASDLRPSRTGAPVAPEASLPSAPRRRTRFAGV